MKKPIAAFTITRNEPFYLKIWCNYYANNFPQNDIYILDNSSDDGSVEEVRSLFPNINVVNVPSKKAYDHNWLKDTVIAFQKKLLSEYEVVCFAETDEFLIPEQTYKSLYEYCNLFRENKIIAKDLTLRSSCWAVVHQFETEPAIDVKNDEYLLQNRNFMRRLPPYDKTLITKRPIDYCRGFHVDKANSNKPAQPDLYMFHAWHVDINIFMDKVARHKKLDISNHLNGSSDLEEAKNWIKYGCALNDNKHQYVGNLVHIPEYWKKLFRI
jgi:hypothetical protein